MSETMCQTFKFKGPIAHLLFWSRSYGIDVCYPNCTLPDTTNTIHQFIDFCVLRINH